MMWFPSAYEILRLPLQIRTNKDGSKTQVVRQYGCNTSSATEPEQSVTYEKNSYVYINSGGANTVMTSAGQEDFPPPTDMLPHPLDDPGGSTRMQDPDDPFGLNHGPRSSSRISGAGNGGTNGGPVGGSGSNAYRSHIVRLNSIEPNTVMFSTKDYPILSDITVPEIIDELEKQFDDKLCDLQVISHYQLLIIMLLQGKVADRFVFALKVKNRYYQVYQFC